MPSTTVDWYRVSTLTAAGIQDKINEALGLPPYSPPAKGGVIYLPPGTYVLETTVEIPYSPPPGGSPYDPAPPITLLGDGPNVTKLVRTASTFTPLASPWAYGEALLSIRRDFTTITGLSFDNTGAGTSGGIVVVGNVPTAGAPTPTGNLRRVNLRDLILRNNSSYILRVTGGAEPTPICTVCSCERCVLSGNGADALLRIETRNTTQEYRQVHFTQFKGRAIDLVGCSGISFHECPVDTALDNVASAPFLAASAARNCQVVNGSFSEGDNPLPTATRWFIDLGQDCHGWTIATTQFTRRIAGDNTAKAIRIGVSSFPSYGNAVIEPLIRVPAGTPLTGSPIELVDAATECVILGGFTEIGTTKVPLEVLDPTTKSVWIGHRRWRVPTLSNSEVALATTNRHLGDLIVRLGQGVQSYSAKSYGNPPDNPWLPLSVNRVADETTLNGIVASAKDKGTLVWVDTPSGGMTNLRVWDGSTWKQIQLV